MDKQDIFTRIKQNKQKLYDYGITRIGVFGSYAKGTNTEKSDVDCLVEFMPEKK